MTAPRSFSGIVESLNFMIEPGIEYNVRTNRSSAMVDIAQCARHLCPP
ncbi:MAG: hypothetical protein ACNYPG_05660 [Candidatus Porifericomitaceae bacterium WSBS_2022_MAG_OTU9]